MLKEQLLKIKNTLLNAVKMAQAPAKVKRVLYHLFKKMNIQKYYGVWVANGYQEEGFQYLIIDNVKNKAIKMCKNITQKELEQIISDIVFATIPA